MTLFVALYISIGYAIKMDPDVYLILGIPLTVCFQLLIRRQPLHRLWLRDGQRFRLARWHYALVALFIIEPARQLVMMCLHKAVTPTLVIYYSIAIAGAFAAAYGFGNLKRYSLRQMFFCLLTGGLAGVSLSFLGALAQALSKGGQVHFNAPVALKSFAIYIPVCFMMEEVVFRGMLDTHITGGRKGTLFAALYVSVLWGLWHLPLSPGTMPLWLAILVLSLVHGIVGIALSIYWRRSGNLAVPATTHAFIDAVRNAMM